LPIKKALIRKTSRADQEFCFEVEADALDSKPKKSLWGGVRPNKVYTFAVPTKKELDRWVEVLELAAKPPEGRAEEVGAEECGQGVTNPMLATGGGLGSFLDKPKEWPEREGLLSKKSKHLLTTWQERYFVLDSASRSLKYYQSKADREGDGGEERGTIPIESIREDKFILISKVDPAIFVFYVKPKTRKYELKAPTPGIAEEWVDVLQEWIELCKAKEVTKKSALERLAEPISP